MQHPLFKLCLLQGNVVLQPAIIQDIPIEPGQDDSGDGTRSPKIVKVLSTVPDASTNRHLRKQVRRGDTDLLTLCGHLSLRFAHVRAATQQVRRHAQIHFFGSQGDRSDAELWCEIARWCPAQDTQSNLRLSRHCLELGDQCLGIVDVDLRLQHIEVISLPSLVPRLRDVEQALLCDHVRLGILNPLLQRSQFDISRRRLRQQTDQDVVILVDRCFIQIFGRGDVAAKFSPKVKLPCCIKTGRPAVIRTGDLCRNQRSTFHGGLADLTTAILTKHLLLLREKCSYCNCALSFCFLDAKARFPKRQVLRISLLDQPRHLRIVEDTPPIVATRQLRVQPFVVGVNPVLFDRRPGRAVLRADFPTIVNVVMDAAGVGTASKHQQRNPTKRRPTCTSSNHTRTPRLCYHLAVSAQHVLAYHFHLRRAAITV